MALFKCKMCGGTLEINNNETVATCEYCGTMQTLPKANDAVVQNLFNRANNLRLKCEFDKAAQIYEKIVEQDDSEAEAHWGIVLCKYGIEYVEDPETLKRIPTCHRTLFDTVTTDADYLAAVDYSDAQQQQIYESEARAIDKIQKNILAIVKNEKPFDVFICYKETDENGKRTIDSAIANEIYHQLTQEDFKVFYAAITLEDKLGQEYEPYIFAALNSAKVMLVIGTKPQHFSAVWVKNEWSRFLKLMRSDRSKLLIPCYRDMDAYDLPEAFAHLQAQDMSKIGFINDVVRGIKKVVTKNAPKTVVVQETVATGGNAVNTAPLLERVFMFLEDGDWQSANEYCEKVLDIDPKCARAYLGKLMAALHVHKQDSLRDQAAPFDNNNNYQKAIRFADEALKNTLTGYLAHINTRNENIRLEEAYRVATQQMARSNTELSYKAAAKSFAAINGYKDAAALSQACYEQAETIRKDEIYKNACSVLNDDHLWIGKKQGIPEYENAIAQFQSLNGWKDSAEKIRICRQKIEDLKAQAEADRLEKERQQEITRQKAKKRAKQTKKIVLIAASAIAVCIALVILWITVFSPLLQYNQAQALLDSGSYDEAIALFTELANYKDSPTKVLETKYAKAEILFASKDYDGAVTIFTELENYKDSPERALQTKYIKAEILFASKDYDGAVTIFTELENYSDSADRIKEVKYSKANALSESKKYAQAAEIYKGLGDYQDCATMYPATVLKHAIALVEQKNFSTAVKRLEILDKYDAYAESTDALYVRIMDAYYADGNYNEALSAYMHTKDYSEDSDKYKDMTYKYAQSLFDQKNYSTAKSTFKKVSGYSDADQKTIDCDYQQGLYELSKKNYSGAINAFERVKDYSDSKEQIKEAKYQYVKANKSRTDTTTHTYLKELKSAKYKDSADIFKELYAWKVEIVAVNSDPDNDKINKTSISVYDPVFFHFQVTGGEPGAESTLKVKRYLPSGETGWYTFTWDVYDGAEAWYGWENGVYTNPAYGTRGTLKIEFYDEGGNKIGEGSVRLTS